MEIPKVTSLSRNDAGLLASAHFLATLRRLHLASNLVPDRSEFRGRVAVTSYRNAVASLHDGYHEKTLVESGIRRHTAYISSTAFQLELSQALLKRLESRARPDSNS